MTGQIAASNQLRTSSELAPNMFEASSELASVIEFGVKSAAVSEQRQWPESGIGRRRNKSPDILHTWWCIQNIQVILYLYIHIYYMV